MSFEVNDETLRDGLQSVSARTPPLVIQAEAVRCLSALGVDAVSLGLPAAGPVHKASVGTLFRTVVQERLSVRAHCAARTLECDLAEVASIQQAVGQKLPVYAFLGTSPVRQFVEGWDTLQLQKLLKEALRFAESNQLSVAFVTEDTIRTHPSILSALFDCAQDEGVQRFVLCDTVGHARPCGVRRLIRFVKARYPGIKIDWHGHNDRGLAVANAMAAIEEGAHRVHGTLFGVGERSGNTRLESLLARRNASPEGLLTGLKTLLGPYLGEVPGAQIVRSAA